jgi:site-specific recombinase XerD
MLLGHTTLQMVSRYVQLAAIDLKAVHAKASPADHLRL